MKTYVENSRFMECICELADKIVEAQFGVGFDKEDDGDGGTKYTEDAQDLFNEKYDEIETLFNTTLGIYSDLYRA